MGSSYKITFNQIEEGTAVLLVRDKEVVIINVPLCLSPPESREGDTLDST